MSKTVTWCGHCGKEEKDHPDGKMCWKVMRSSALGVRASDPKALLSEMLRQKERADAAETEARRWRESAETWERRFNAERADWRTAIEVANAMEAERDALQRKLENERALRGQEELAKFEAYHRENEAIVERDALKARLDKAEADAKAAMERVERLTWEANGSPMKGEDDGSAEAWAARTGRLDP